MAITAVPGINVDVDGKRIINKEYRGIRLFRRLGVVTQEHAERRLRREIARIDAQLERTLARSFNSAPHATLTSPNTNAQ